MIKVNVLAKDGLFLFRFNDGEFGSKWCGIWKGRTKYFDYFAFNVNGEFLSRQNISDFTFYNSQFARYTFKTKDGTVTEDTSCTSDAIIVSLRCDFPAQINTEVGVNIRDRTENYVLSKLYAVEDSKNMIKISYNDKKAFIYYTGGEFIQKQYYGVHRPGLYARENGFSKYFDDGSVQNKFIPGIITTKLDKDQNFILILSTKELDNESRYKMLSNWMISAKEYGDMINTVSNTTTISEIPSDLLKGAIDALYSYSDPINRSIYAGFPYFNEFWTRDALFILPSYLSMNQTKFVRDILSRISAFVTENGIPATEGGNLYPMDVPALFIIDSYEYYMRTGDRAMIKSMEEKFRLLSTLFKKRFENGLVHDKGRETWMDSLDREYSIEVQAMWSSALQDLYKMSEILGAGFEWTADASDALFVNLNKYRRERYFKDQLDADINTANQIFLPYFLDLNPKDSKLITENIKEKLLTEYGVVSVSQDDKSFNVDGYHNGAIWPFLTTIAAGVSYNIDKEVSERCMKILGNNLDLQCSSRINEIIRVDGHPEGCPSQAWSIGLLPNIIDKFILGIKVNAPEKTISIKTPEDISFHRSINVLNRNVEIEYEEGKFRSNHQFERQEDKIIIKLD